MSESVLCPACRSDNVWSEEHLEEVDGPNRRNQRDRVVVEYSCEDCGHRWQGKEDAT